MKYEIECVHFPGYHMETKIALLTGYELPEILPLTSQVKKWNGKAFIDTFRSLGYNCNNRFIKWDKHTDKPCVMRCKVKEDKKYWYGFVYNNDKVYVINRDETIEVDYDDFRTHCSEYKPTSMLQVWI